MSDELLLLTQQQGVLTGRFRALETALTALLLQLPSEGKAKALQHMENVAANSVDAAGNPVYEGFHESLALYKRAVSE